MKYVIVADEVVSAIFDTDPRVRTVKVKNKDTGEVEDKEITVPVHSSGELAEAPNKVKLGDVAVRDAAGKITGFTTPAAPKEVQPQEDGKGGWELPPEASDEEKERLTNAKEQYEAQADLDELMNTTGLTNTKRVERIEKFLASRFGVVFKN